MSKLAISVLDEMYRRIAITGPTQNGGLKGGVACCNRDSCL